LSNWENDFVILTQKTHFEKQKTHFEKNTYFLSWGNRDIFSPFSHDIEGSFDSK